MKFKFAFESLLKHRKRLEEIAQKEYLLAKAEVDEALQEIEDIYNQINQLRNSIVESKDLLSSAQAEDYIQGLTAKIEIKREKVRELMLVAEEKHENLLERSVDFRVIDKLKQKQLKKHKEKEKKKEIKEMDDIVTMTFKRSQSL